MRWAATRGEAIPYVVLLLPFRHCQQWVTQTTLSLPQKRCKTKVTSFPWQLDENCAFFPYQLVTAASITFLIYQKKNRNTQRHISVHGHKGFMCCLGSSTILRAYIAAVSTTDDRARAYSSIVVANMLSVVIGPSEWWSRCFCQWFGREALRADGDRGASGLSRRTMDAPIKR